MAEPPIEIRHRFEVDLALSEGTLQQRLLVCNALDAYELREGVSSELVTDVLRLDETSVTLKVTPRSAVTYEEIGEHLGAMATAAAQATGGLVQLRVVAIRFEVETFGTVSDLLTAKDLQQDPKRAALLHRLNLEPAAEGGGGEGRFSLAGNRTYLSKDGRGERAYEVFADLVHHGKEGLLITRRQPADLRQRYHLQRTPILWLTLNSFKGETCLAPTEVPRLHVAVGEFLERAKSSVVLLDGLEYLVTNNTFPTALKLVQLLSDKVMLHDSRLLVTLAPEGFEPKELALLERDMEHLP